MSWAAKGRGWWNDNKGPWGSSGGGSGGSKPPSGGGNGGDGNRGPWGEPPRPGPRRPGGNVTSLDELLRQRLGRFGRGGGGGGGFSPPSRSLFTYIFLGILALWILGTSVHRIAPGEAGVVTVLGRYYQTLTPGIGLTLPAPLARVQKVNIEEIRNTDLGSAAEETLMLTGDQNIIDIAYQVRWNVRDPEQYLFELATPEDTVRQVAESSMRQILAQVTLQDAIGNRRGEIEARVAQEMQSTLDRYRAGVVIRGVAVRQADPPAQVNDAFKDVTAAQQDAESEINKATAYALQLSQVAQGQATAFDKVYEQYRLAPEVTRRRMYYETMERVLRNVDKTIVETPGVTPYLPLPQVQRQVQRPATPQGAGQ